VEKNSKSKANVLGVDTKECEFILKNGKKFYTTLSLAGAVGDEDLKKRVFLLKNI
jgi:hypothetical protein